jgi:hypothetical protein
VADANGPYVCSEGSAILFDGSNSTDADGESLEYRWDFENDATWDTEWSSSPFASFTWYDEYTGDVRLEATDGNSSNSDITDVKVNNVAPAVDVGADASIFSGQTFTIVAGFTDPGINDKPWNYDIDYGDSSNYLSSTNIQGADTIVNSHEYLIPGAYTINVSVTDKDGETGSGYLTIQVKPLPVAVDIKPGSTTNPINPKSKGTIPVGVLSGIYEGINFNATSIVFESLQLAGTPAMPIGKSSKDLDKDGDLDMVFHFKTQTIQWSNLTTQTCLSGRTNNGVYFEACDNIKIVPSKQK